MKYNRYVYIFLGAMIGALLRVTIIFGIGILDLPFMTATFVVNMLGAFLFGLIFVTVKDQKYVLTFTTGCLGTFTTFSALSLELTSLLETGEFITFSIYVFSSMCLGMILFILGAKLGEKRGNRHA